MSFFHTKPNEPKNTAKSVLDSIDEITNIQVSTQQSLNDMQQSNEVLRKSIEEQAKALNIDLKGNTGNSGTQNHSTTNSFTENFKQETGHNIIEPNKPEFGDTESTEKDTATKENISKKSEVPLLSRKTVVGIGDRLKQSVFGQDKVIDVVEDRLVVNTVNLNINEDKPVGCFLFAGPSGVGKTEMCVQLAKQLDVPILVLNMGEHGLEQDVTKLIGVASGYVGYANGGLLTNFVLENPRCIIVFDELEKAHVSINKILLSIMDKGVCRDNKNREVFFNETLFIATTNLGASIEYETHLTDEEKFDYRMRIIKENLAPEIINRYDNIFQFQALTPEIYGNIVRKFTQQLSDNAKKRNNFEIKTSDALIEFATKHSYDPAMGGRPARRFIEMIILKPLAYKLLDEKMNADIVEKGSITLDIKDNKITFKLDKKIIGKLDNTMELVADYNRGKFSEVVEEEVDEKSLPSSEIPNELQLESSKEKNNTMQLAT